MIKKIFSNKVISFIIIPGLLFLFWIAASLAFNNKISFSVLEFAEGNSSISQAPVGKMLKGDVITGTFTARENNLGLVLLEFNNYVKPDYASEDILIFSIKRIGEKDWYYSREYRSGGFEHLIYFPFGFNPITNSGNNTYQFQLKSLNGNTSNALTLSKSSPVLMTGYQFTKAELLQNKSFLIRFLLEKIETSFTNLDFVLSSILYLLPLLFYVLFLLYHHKPKLLVRYLGNTTLVLIIVDIFLIQSLYLGILFGLIITWIVAVKLKKIKSSTSFKIAFILLFLWIILMALGENAFSPKLNVWTYAFLVIGIFNAVVEEKIITK
jgi:hypothetical protein